MFVGLRELQSNAAIRGIIYSDIQRGDKRVDTR